MNKNIPVQVHKFFKKIACAKTAEPRMTVSYTTNIVDLYFPFGLCILASNTIQECMQMIKFVSIYL